MASDSPAVVVLGPSYAGIPAAQRLIRSLPAEYKVYLVGPSKQLYWNFAAPRGVASSSFAKGLFANILPGFTQHAESRFEFIQGTATALDPKSNTVTITPQNDEGATAAARTITYTNLLIATGSRAVGDWPFKALGSKAATLAALADAQVKIEAASSIVLSGAGATGVETAGEIATLHKGKRITLLDSSPDGPLPMLREDVRKAARSQLESLKVTVKSGVRVVSESTVDGAVQLVLSNGETLTADLHIPTYGIIPNTEFAPAELLTESKNVKVSEFLQSTVYPNIWAAGDAAGTKHNKGYLVAGQVDSVVHNLLASVAGKGTEAFKPIDDDDKATFVTIGNGFAMGTGIAFGWKPWGLLVWFLKGRDFFLSKMPDIATGKKFNTGAKV